MENIWILSDLHLEYFRNAGSTPQFDIPVAADVIVLAGDIDTGCNGIAFAGELQQRSGLPVVYVPGNHEFYGFEHALLRESLREAGCRAGVAVLDEDRFQVGDVAFLGATLWTDYRLLGDEDEESAKDRARHRLDFSMIGYDAERSFAPEDAQRAHFSAVEWLNKKLKEEPCEKRVVITHHLPHPTCIAPEYHGEITNVSYSSNLSQILGDHSIDLWVHGHTHTPVDVMVSETRIVCNPHGCAGREDTAEYDWAFIAPV